MLDGKMTRMQPSTGNSPIEIEFASVPESGSCFIDCRSEDEFEIAHQDEAINVPLQHLSLRLDDFPFQKEDTFYVYCNSGNRSATFVTYLRSIGYEHCQSIAGGFETWGQQSC